MDICRQITSAQANSSNLKVPPRVDSLTEKNIRETMLGVAREGVEDWEREWSIELGLVRIHNSNMFPESSNEL